MVYNKQTWVDDNESYPLNAQRLNHIEDGIGDVDTRLAYVESNGVGSGNRNGWGWKRSSKRR